MIFGGISQILIAFKAFDSWRRINWILFGLLYLFAGVFSFKAPFATAAALTWVVATFIILGGIVRIFTAFQVRPLNGWWWALLSGILLVIVGILISINPTSPLWLLGLMLGLDLFVQGINLLTLAFMIKKL